MSGNPFRRKNIDQAFQHGSDELDHNQVEARVPSIDTDVRKPSKKTVRIISPHSAGSDNGTHIPDVLFSPPPHVRKPIDSQWDTIDSSEDSPSSIDPFNTEDDDGGATTEDEDLKRNTLENAGSFHSQAFERQRATPNPFNSTATLGTLTGHKVDRQDKLAAQPKTKPYYNVDEFKNLLLTGKKSTSDTPTPATPPVSFHAPPVLGDTSSNTDASSISRHSIFEPPPEARPDSPRKSHELSSSDEERQKLVQGALDSKGRKPPTPRSHHGKPVAENTRNADRHQGPLSPVDRAKVSDSYFGRSPPTSPRTPTDLNKPLPAPPSESFGISLFDPLRGPIQAEPDQASASSDRKKGPPPPPSARPQGPTRPKSFLGNTGPSQRPLENNPPDAPQADSSTPSKPSLPQESNVKPPPPPPRRPAPVRGMSASSTTSGVSTVPTPSSSTFSDDSSTPRIRPPVPPTRNRSSSSLKRQSTLPAQMSSTGVPPVPPPPRRGSSQSSFSPSRLSGDYQSSFAERQRADSGASSVQSKDVMADLSTLQKEVDALRGKFGT